MPKVAKSFDPQAVEWRRVTDPSETTFLIDFEYSLLGYDAVSGRLDMLLRFSDNSGHCRRHRHIAATATLVLEGEQHVSETLPTRSVNTFIRKKDDYALADPDAAAHMERGGPNGGTILLSMSAPDGRFFEYFDEDMKSIGILTIEDYVAAWNRGSIPGAVDAPKASAA